MESLARDFRLALRTKVVGQTLHLNGHPMTIVGVAPPGFNGLEVGAAPDVFVPLTMKAQMTPTWDHLDNRRSRWLNVLARLKPGMTIDQAEAGANVLYRQLLQEELDLVPGGSQKFRERYAQNHLYLRPGFRGLSQLRQSASLPLFLLMGMVGLVLLIACANVANLLLARGAARQRELAIRLALGARARDLARQRLVAGLSAAFGLLATLLAAVGLYGVMSYTVTRRTREIGIRMAIGAERASVLWLVLKEVSLLAAIGIGLGAPLALALSRLVQSQLFGLTPYDPLTLALATLGLAVVTLGSGYLPARRATRVDPMSALRYE